MEEKRLEAWFWEIIGKDEPCECANCQHLNRIFMAGAASYSAALAEAMALQHAGDELASIKMQIAMLDEINSALRASPGESAPERLH
ncbi:MAG: hypothetical protein AAF618_00290 [Pseudomonadota bacterium]